MPRKQVPQNQLYIENSNAVYRSSLQQCLYRLSADQKHWPQSLREFEDIIRDFSNGDDERYSITISSVQECIQSAFNPVYARSISLRCESIRLLCIVAEFFKDKILDYLPKILAIFTKRITSSPSPANPPSNTSTTLTTSLAAADPNQLDADIQIAIAETFGSIFCHSLPFIDILSTAQRHLNIAIAFIQRTLTLATPSTTTIALLCLHRLIQNTPSEIIATMPNEFIDLCFYAATQEPAQLESLLAAIVSLEKNFTPYAITAAKLAMTHLAESQWNVRKLAIDILTCLTLLMPDSLENLLDELINSLNNAQNDKIKHVREAAALSLANLSTYYGESLNVNFSIASNDSKFKWKLHQQQMQLLQQQQQQQQEEEQKQFNQQNVKLKNSTSSNQFKKQNADNQQRPRRSSASQQQQYQQQQQSTTQQQQLQRPKRTINPQFLKNAVKEEVEIITEKQQRHSNSQHQGQQDSQEQASEQSNANNIVITVNRELLPGQDRKQLYAQFDQKQSNTLQNKHQQSQVISPNHPAIIPYEQNKHRSTQNLNRNVDTFYNTNSSIDPYDTHHQNHRNNNNNNQTYSQQPMFQHQKQVQQPSHQHSNQGNPNRDTNVFTRFTARSNNNRNGMIYDDRQSGHGNSGEQNDDLHEFMQVVDAELERIMTDLSHRSAYLESMYGAGATPIRQNDIQEYETNQVQQQQQQQQQGTQIDYYMNGGHYDEADDQNGNHKQYQNVTKNNNNNNSSSNIFTDTHSASDRFFYPSAIRKSHEHNNNNNNTSNNNNNNNSNTLLVEESDVVGKINQYIEEDLLNEAYGIALTSNSDRVLQGLMKSTNVCLDRLSEVHQQSLLSRICDQLDRFEEVHSGLIWLNSYMEVSPHIVLDSPVSRQLVKQSLLRIVEAGNFYQVSHKDHGTCLKILHAIDAVNNDKQFTIK